MLFDIEPRRGAKEAKPYRYFDTPDGQDVPKKLWCFLKPATLCGLGLSTIDVMLHSHPKGYLPTIGRYVYITAPVVGMAATFVIATNGVANIRKTDDKLNWAIGGCAAGSVFGVWRRSATRGFIACAAFTFLALLQKSANQYGWVLIPDRLNPMNGGVNSVRNDWSLMAERPRNWTNGKE